MTDVSDPKKPLQLMDLPPEILQRIIEDIHAMEYECQLSESQEDLGHTFCRPLAAMMGTCKAFHTMGAPFFFADLDFEFCDNNALERFIESSLRYASLFRSIYVRVSPDSDELGQMGMLYGFDDAQLEKRHALVGKIIKASINLKVLDIDIDSARTRLLLPDILPQIPWTSVTELILCPLEHEDDTVYLKGTDLAHIIAVAFPSLETVDLQSVVRGSAEMLEALSGLKNLKHLDLYGCECIDDTWAERKWAGDLCTLALSICPRLTPKGCDALIHKFKESLQSLALDGTPLPKDLNSNVDDYEAGTPDEGQGVGPYDLPHLTHLKVGHLLCSMEWYHRFRNCKLEIFHITDDQLAIEAGEFMPFLDEHASTLTQVIVSSLLVADWEQALRNWCDQHSIDFAVESDSEVSDSDGLDDSFDSDDSFADYGDNGHEWEDTDEEEEEDDDDDEFEEDGF